MIDSRAVEKYQPTSPVAMDAPYYSGPREFWQIIEDLKELHAVQFEQAERIARLERRREEDARLKSVWGPLSPFPTPLGSSIPTGTSVIQLIFWPCC